VSERDLNTHSREISPVGEISTGRAQRPAPAGAGRFAFRPASRGGGRRAMSGAGRSGGPDPARRSRSVLSTEIGQAKYPPICTETVTSPRVGGDAQNGSFWCVGQSKYGMAPWLLKTAAEAERPTSASCKIAWTGMDELTTAGQFATRSAANNWANENDDSIVSPVSNVRFNDTASQEVLGLRVVGGEGVHRSPLPHLEPSGQASGPAARIRRRQRQPDAPHYERHEHGDVSDEADACAPPVAPVSSPRWAADSGASPANYTRIRKLATHFRNLVAC
jgi:hypothetical protein